MNPAADPADAAPAATHATPEETPVTDPAPTPPKVCAYCAAGDHTTHKPDLGGICIGCPCPTRASSASLSATAMSGAYTVGKVATLTVCVHGEVAAVSDGHVVIGGHVLPTRLSETVRVVSTDPPAPPSIVLDDWADHECGDDRAVTVWQELVRNTHDDEHPHDAFPVCPHTLCRHARGA